MKKIFLLFLFLFSTPAFPLTFAPGDTLLLTVINRSDHTLEYKKTAHTLVGNIFTLTSSKILPGGRITIQASTSHFTGIKGDITFEDSKGHQDILHISDPLQIGLYKQSANFSLSSPHLVAFLPSRTLNKDASPYGISLTHATVEIQNRLA